MNATNSVKLRAEQLDDRLVPAVYNLSSAGAEAGPLAGTFIARQVNVAAADSSTFLRLDGNRTEEGYNTTARRSQFDEVRGNYSRALTLDQVPIVVINGVAYREFLLSVNENRLSPRISIDEVQIFLGNRSNLTGYNERRGTLAGMRPVFDLDANGNNTIIVDDRLNGSGRASDMALLVRADLFTGQDGSFVYLYSEMGETAGARSNGGVEEWRVRTRFSAPPSTGSVSISGRVVDQVGAGIEGVQINLYKDGQFVTSVATQADGTFTFTESAPGVPLQAGTYDIEEVQPEGYLDGPETAGTHSELDPDQDFFASITLSAGQHATGYVFAEQLDIG